MATRSPLQVLVDADTMGQSVDIDTNTSVAVRRAFGALVRSGLAETVGADDSSTIDKVFDVLNRGIDTASRAASIKTTADKAKADANAIKMQPRQDARKVLLWAVGQDTFTSDDVLGAGLLTGDEIDRRIRAALARLTKRDLLDAVEGEGYAATARGKRLVARDKAKWEASFGELSLRPLTLHDLGPDADGSRLIHAHGGGKWARDAAIARIVQAISARTGSPVRAVDGGREAWIHIIDKKGDAAVVARMVAKQARIPFHDAFGDAYSTPADELGVCPCSLRLTQKGRDAVGGSGTYYRPNGKPFSKKEILGIHAVADAMGVPWQTLAARPTQAVAVLKGLGETGDPKATAQAVAAAGGLRAYTYAQGFGGGA